MGLGKSGEIEKPFQLKPSCDQYPPLPLYRINAVLYGIGGGVWGVSEAALHGALRADSIGGVVIAAAVGSGIGLIGGMKKAYDDFQIETASCS